MPSRDWHLTDDQRTYSGKKMSLAAVAMAWGCDGVVECPAKETMAVLETVLESGEMTKLASKCESGKNLNPATHKNLTAIRRNSMKPVRD